MPLRVNLNPECYLSAKLIHSWDRYPAKLNGKLARYIITNVSKVGDFVLDPFGGCGTVQVECSRLGRHSQGIDINPIAALLANAKSQRYDLLKVRELATEVVANAKRKRNSIGASVCWLDYWFSRATLEKLRSIHAAISDRPSQSKYTSLLLACLAVSVRKCSRADPRSPKPFISQRARSTRFNCHFDAYSIFCDVAKAFCDASEAMWFGIEKNSSAKSTRGDSRQLKRLVKCPADAIVTSPPYLSAQDYWRSSKLEHAIVFPDDGHSEEIGPSIIGSGRGSLKRDRAFLSQFDWSSRPFRKLASTNPHSAAIAMRYLLDMNQVLEQIREVLRRGGICCLVVGDCQIAEIKLPISTWCIELAQTNGFKLMAHEIDAIKNRRIPPQRAGHESVISDEHLLYFC
jgi:DNA modification methylase